jgi:ribulose-5-phosphate 4-epimerase/fuculose-1-phosphate aldolase
MTGNVVCRLKIDCFIRPAGRQAASEPIHLSNYATKTLDCIMHTHQVNAKSRDVERGRGIKKQHLLFSHANASLNFPAVEGE